MIQEIMLKSRVKQVRLRLGYLAKDFPDELGVAFGTYKNWEIGVRETAASDILISVLKNPNLSPYFSYMLTGCAHGLPAQIGLDSAASSEGGRIKQVREHLGLSRAKLGHNLAGFSMFSMKNYENLLRLRIPSEFYELLVKHAEFSQYVVFILTGSQLPLHEQKDLDSPALVNGEAVNASNGKVIQLPPKTITGEALFEYAQRYTERAMLKGESRIFPSFNEVRNRFKVTFEEIESVMNKYEGPGYIDQITNCSMGDGLVEITKRGNYLVEVYVNKKGLE